MVYKPGFTKTVLQYFLLENNYWEPSLDCRQDGLVEQTHSCRELAEQPMTSALVHCHEKAKCLSVQLSSLFLLDDIE